MVCKKKIAISRIFLIAVILCASSNLLLGQDNYRYNGRFTLDTLSGLSTYTFKMNGQDTIKEGAFEFKYSNVRDLINGKDNYLSIKGNFDTDKPSEKWFFNFGEFQATDSSVFKNYKYNVNISGKQTTSMGNLKNSKPNGEWVHTICKISNSVVTDTIFRSSINFKEGIPQKSFRIQNQNMFLAGRFLRGGLAHDQWELYSNESMETVESWVFQDGLLKRIIINESDSIKTYSIYSDQIKNTETLSLGEKYLGIIEIQQAINSNSNDPLPIRMLSLLKQNSDQYQRVGHLVSELGVVDFMPKFRVKAAYYPMNEKELLLMDSVENFYNQAFKINASLLKSTQLNLLKFTDSEVLFHLEALKELNDKHLNFIESIIQYKRKDVLNYIERDSIINNFWKHQAQIFPLEIQYEVKDRLRYKKFSVEGVDFNKSDNAGIQALYLLSKNTYLYHTKLQEKLEQKLKSKELKNELEVLESNLISASNSLGSTLDSLQKASSEVNKKTLNAIKGMANQSLEEYSLMEGVVVKQEEAKNLIVCLNNLEELAKSINNLSEQQKEIEELYVDDIWNPFTSTVMSERVKTRIVQAYNEVLVPFILDEIKNNLNCANTVSLKRLNQKIHKRMIELREEDTEKIERKLRKEKDPKTILTLFEINTQLKSEVE